jgi:NAD(P)-dependent dehydrogenase (short-subunit alcohol dehydrogenase family)
MSPTTPIIFITGANTGLGLETVKSLVQSSKSYTILLGGRSLEKANAAAQEVRSQFAQSSSVIETLQVDIENDSSIQAAFEHINTSYGHLDVLINNAGSFPFPSFTLKN